jgi:5'-nucleotidase/UDP-sugar diphosphatase
MQKDLKIGMGVGLGLVAVVAMWLATRPSLTPEARMQRLHSAEAGNAAGAPPSVQYAAAEPPVVTRKEPTASAPGPKPANRDSGLNAQTTDREQRTSTIENPPSKVVNRQPSVETERTEPVKTERFYFVRKGDTLSSIAKTYYGSASKWPKIFDANRNVIPDANKLAVGAKLVIPD